MKTAEKVASAYEAAFVNAEKQASLEFVKEAYGVEGYLPLGYAEAFLEKEAVLAGLGKMVARGGSALAGKLTKVPSLQKSVIKGTNWAARNKELAGGLAAGAAGGTALLGAEALAGRRRN